MTVGPLYPSHDAYITSLAEDYPTLLAGTASITSSDRFGGPGSALRPSVIAFDESPPDPAFWIATEGFLRFDVSAADGLFITGGALEVYGVSGSSTAGGSFDLLIYAYPYTPPLLDTQAEAAPADWVPTDTFDSLTLVGSGSCASWTTSGYNSFSFNAAITAAVEDAIANHGGMLGLLVVHSTLETPISWPEAYGAQFWSAEETQPGERRPRITLIEGTVVSLGGMQAAPSGHLAVLTGRLLAGNQPAASGGIAPALAYGAPGRGRRLPIPAGTARVTTPRPASGSIRTRRDGVL